MMKVVLREARLTWLLAVPLMAGQLSQMLMGLVDTKMIGKLGSTELATAALANTILHLPLMLGIGVAIAVSVKVSQARGAKNQQQARATLRTGVLMSLVTGLATIIFTFAVLAALPHLKQDTEVVDRISGYLILVGISMTPAMVGMAVRSHADAMERPWPIFWIILASVFLNVFLNWLLIEGNWGIPALGLEGAGIATLLARLAGMAGAIVWCRKSPGISEWVPRRWFKAPEPEELRQFWKIAWPSSLQVSAEITAFVGVAMVIGSLGAESLAAHQVVLMCVATTFMVPLGISMALTVRVGESFGAETFERARPIVLGGWMMGAMFSLLCLIVFLSLDRQLADYFLDDPGPLAMAASLFLIGAIFQAVDHSQILSSGVLRGLDDVKVPAIITFVSHWMIGMPLGVFLTFHQKMGVAGVWWGLASGLAFAAIFLGHRAWKMTRPVEVSKIRDANAHQ